MTESETWQSGDLDTSQVSVSSLPEDDKSEPTTATVSSTAIIDITKKTVPDAGEYPRHILLSILSPFSKVLLKMSIFCEYQLRTLSCSQLLIYQQGLTVPFEKTKFSLFIEKKRITVTNQGETKLCAKKIYK